MVANHSNACEERKNSPGQNAEDLPANEFRAPSGFMARGTGFIGIPPARFLQIVELIVFLLLILPALSTSFMIGTQSDMNFTSAAIFSILNDLGLVSLVFYFIWRNGEPFQHLGWTGRAVPKEIGWGVLLFLPVTYGANLLEGALHTAGFSEPSKLPSFLVANGNDNIALAVLLVIVVAIVEETVYRGYLILRLNAVARRPWIAVLFSAAIFALGHGYEGAAGVVSVYFLGVVLALVYLWRRSLIAPMIIHFMIDFTSIVLSAMAGGTS